VLGDVAEPARGLAKRLGAALGAPAHVAALDGGEQQAGERLAAAPVADREMRGEERAPVGEGRRGRRTHAGERLVEVERDGAHRAARAVLRVDESALEQREQRAHLRARAARPRQRFVHRGVHARAVARQRLDGDLPLAVRKEVVDRALGHAAGGHDLVDPGARKPAATHQLDRGVEEAGFGGGAFGRRHRWSKIDRSI
jgi:hypothetical protein